MGMSDKKWDHLAGPERLKKWRGSEKLTQQEAADLMAIDLASYNAFENARERPGLDIAVRMEDATKGRVEPKHWADNSKSESRKAS